ncbi:hypothetical protein TPY_0075 [Sulfobacillus acidophilus TPY]|uniref:Uncharacterized protein n=1 Tax=Sulfobacillus acidophilus (strain ATCC 700253 / DSM 10332 / NAL) TaxID=679936 RepID=G8TVK3_SULAD|nr:hypothetical protein TPY_0075 [Sulfobacillus acidophilus TPY]AEW03642.1 hypothetical protein Sulac_0068 [Sulfobacillus acidophilus DSM 10332]
MWRDVLFDAYKTAYDKFQRDHPQITPHFWELEMFLPEDDLETAARAVVQEIRLKGWAECPRASTLFLRYLLRTRLSAIRGNRLWPEVGRFLRSYTAFDVPDAVLQRYFRESLQQVHRRELPHHHNKYVMFLISDTGAGLARSRSVKVFLWDAATEYRDQVGHLDGRSFLREYMARRQSDDLSILSVVLEPTLLALFDMVDYAEHHEIPSASEWETARGLLQTRNIDIDRLLPEAQEMIGDLLRDIARWSRRVHKVPHVPLNRPPRLKLHGRPIATGVVPVRFAQERIEVFSNGDIPQTSPGVSISSKTVDGIKRHYLRGWPVDRLAWIQVGASRWTVINTSQIEVVLPAESVKWDDITVLGNHCHVIQASRGNDISVNYPEDFEGQLALQLSVFPGDVKTIPLVRGHPISLDDLISDTGPFAIDVLYQGRSLDLTTYGYFFNQPPQRQTGQLGRPALLQWVDGQGQVITLSSKTPVEVSTVDENKFVRGTYVPVADRSWTLEFHWKPWVSDVVLQVDGQRIILDSSITVKAEKIRETVTLEPVGLSHGSCEVYVDGLDGSSELTGFPEMLKGVLRETAAEIPVVVQGPGWTKRFVITADLEIVQVHVDWGDRQPKGEVCWISLPGQRPVLMLNGRQGTWETFEEEELVGPIGYRRFRGKIAWPAFETDGERNQSVPILLWKDQSWVPVAEITPPPLKDPGDILRVLKSRIDKMVTAGDAWEVVYAFERYTREANALPPISSDKVVRLMRAIQDPGAEDAVNTFRLLEEIIKRHPSPRYDVRDVFGIDVKSRVFYLSLLVVNQQQLFLKGMGNPQECDKLIDALRQYFDDQSIDFWSRLMVRYCQEIAGFVSHDKLPARLLTDPVFLSDEGLRHWLSQVYNVEESAG